MQSELHELAAEGRRPPPFGFGTHEHGRQVALITLIDACGLGWHASVAVEAVRMKHIAAIITPHYGALRIAKHARVMRAS